MSISFNGFPGLACLKLCCHDTLGLFNGGTKIRDTPKNRIGGLIITLITFSNPKLHEKYIRSNLFMHVGHDIAIP